MGKLAISRGTFLILSQSIIAAYMCMFGLLIRQDQSEKEKLAHSVVVVWKTGKA